MAKLFGRDYTRQELLERCGSIDQFGGAKKVTLADGDEAGVEAVLRGRLNIRFVVQDRYDSDPPAARDKNDLSAIGALAYKL